MSVSCLMAFIVLVVSILSLARLWKAVNIGGNTRIRNLAHFLRLWQRHTDVGARTILVLGFVFTVLIVGGFKVFMTVTGGLLVSAFVAVCGPPGSLETIRAIIVEVFDFIRDILGIERPMGTRLGCPHPG